MCVEAFTIDNQRFVSTCVPVNVGDLGEVVAEGANDVPFAEVRSLDAEGIAVRKKNGAMCPYAEGEWFKLEAADK